MTGVEPRSTGFPAPSSGQLGLRGELWQRKPARARNEA
ncbi:hypothetical protein DB32_003320 [Sandaracinus amylolyticus]|uniref:Uncharacterized protein n=1 Tax=Sandaracinus amylolyticus TaxID=927083 RepID=A0A0F6W398_9BACT|nr:hypothetical protein DB32_003320 [Sandaracinus amylolyticus]